MSNTKISPRYFIAAIFLLASAVFLFGFGLGRIPYSNKAIGIFAALCAIAPLGAGGARFLIRGLPYIAAQLLAAYGFAQLSGIINGIALLFAANIGFALYFFLCGRFSRGRLAVAAAWLAVFLIYFFAHLTPGIPDVAGGLQTSVGLVTGVFFSFFLTAALIPAGCVLLNAGPAARCVALTAGAVCAFHYYILAEGLFGGSMTFNRYYFFTFALSLFLLACAATMTAAEQNRRRTKRPFTAPSAAVDDAVESEVH